MKKTVFLLLFIILLPNLYSQAYKKLTDSTNKWNYLDQAFTTCYCGEAKTYSLYLTNDTTLSGTVYKKVMSKIIREEDTNTVYAAGLREDTINQKVYVKINDNKEKLIYSFDHEVGDTIFMDTSDYYYTIKYVKAIDPYDFGGFNGKKITVWEKRINISDQTIEDDYQYDSWYEGIGSLNELFDFSHIGGMGVNTMLLCFWNKGIQYYQNPNYTVCEYAEYVGVEEEHLNSNPIEIYQNLASGQVTVITNKKIKEVSVYNIKGIMLIKQNDVVINMNSLPGGVYIIKVQMMNNEYVIEKVIK
jgi:hypothetical protein